jgi:hypothetical protein
MGSSVIWGCRGVLKVKKRNKRIHILVLRKAENSSILLTEKLCNFVRINITKIQGHM